MTTASKGEPVAGGTVKEVTSHPHTGLWCPWTWRVPTRPAAEGKRCRTARVRRVRFLGKIVETPPSHFCLVVRPQLAGRTGGLGSDELPLTSPSSAVVSTRVPGQKRLWATWGSPGSAATGHGVEPGPGQWAPSSRSPAHLSPGLGAQSGGRGPAWRACTLPSAGGFWGRSAPRRSSWPSGFPQVRQNPSEPEQCRRAPRV